MRDNTRVSLTLFRIITVALGLSYYVVAWTLFGAVFYITYSFYQSGPSGTLRMFWRCCYLLTGWFVVAGLPWPRRFPPSGVRIYPWEQPSLFSRVEKLARMLRQKPPVEIYLTEDASIGAYHCRGFLGIGGRRCMAIGLPFLHLATLSQFDSMVARCFGHFRYGATRFRWLHRTRIDMDEAAMMMTFGRSSKWWLTIHVLPILGIRKLFMRAMHGIWRNQEKLSDRFAVKAVGFDAFTDAVRLVSRHERSFIEYLYYHVYPAIRVGRYLPLLDGFEQYCERISPAEEANRELRERADHSPAISLVEDVPELERGLLKSLKSVSSDQMRRTSWKEAGPLVILPYWRHVCRHNSRALEGFTLQSFHYAVTHLDGFLAVWRGASLFAHSELGRNVAKEILAAALGCALSRSGWWIDYAPGYVRMCSRQAEIDPRQFVDEISAPEFTAETWRQTLERLDLDPDLSLAL